MRKSRNLLAAALALASATAFATAPAPKPASPKAEAAAQESPEDAAFSAKWSEAMKSLGTNEGATYDEQVGKYLATLPEYKPSIRECMAKNPGKQTVTGYLEY